MEEGVCAAQGEFVVDPTRWVASGSVIGGLVTFFTAVSGNVTGHVTGLCCPARCIACYSVNHGIQWTQFVLYITNWPLSIDLTTLALIIVGGQFISLTAKSRTAASQSEYIPTLKLTSPPLYQLEMTRQ